MNYAMQRLAFLVEIKNDLNRKRRRFRAIMGTPRYRRSKAKVTWNVVYQEKESSIIGKDEARQGYDRARRQMKAMTSLMRRVQKEAGAFLVWGDGGQIQAIGFAVSKIGYGYHWVKDGEVAKLAALYRADRILLG